MLTLTDATVAVARYLSAVRRTRSASSRSRDEQLRAASEDDFVRAAPVFSKAHRIEYHTWREFGVCSSVLRKAGIVPHHRHRAQPRRRSHPH